MKFKGTEGHWVAELNNDKNVNVTSWINNNAKGFVYSINLNNCEDIQETKANAKLIADGYDKGTQTYLEILELIKKATTI